MLKNTLVNVLEQFMNVPEQQTDIRDGVLNFGC